MFDPYQQQQQQQQQQQHQQNPRALLWKGERFLRM